MKALRPNLRVAAAQHGYTLVELLVAITLGSVVLASLGGVLLVSELKVSANIQRNLNAKDEVNRAIDLIRREATLASRVDLGDGEGPANPPNCDNNTPLMYYQRTDDLSAKSTKICYKTVALKDLPPDYKDSLKGPCVLIRLAPPFLPNGNLYNSPGLIPQVQVLVDSVAGTDECAPGGFSANIESSSVRRKASAQIKLASNASYNFNVQIPSNLPYDGVNLYRKCLKPISTLADACASDSNVRHYLVEKFPLLKAKWEAEPSAENLFYFQNPYSEYALSKDSSSGFCTYAECYVMRGDYKVQLSNVDVLIFPDKEIRPTR